MSDLLQYAVEQVNVSEDAFCRFITVNDTGENGSHQSGFYIPKCASKLLFDTPGERGSNKDRYVKILWQNSFTTNSRFIYYGQGTRNEYRITRFGRGFEFFTDDNVGNLLILCKITEDDYSGIILSSDEDIDTFFAYFNLTSDKTNQIIDKKHNIKPELFLENEINDLILKYDSFPDTSTMSLIACTLYNECNGVKDVDIQRYPDIYLLKWLETETNIFYDLEEKLYKPVYTKPFSDCQSLVAFSNEILNRRKSRAGKSLEKHLSYIFNVCNIEYSAQAVTEGNKRPDFIFPGIEYYHNLQFPVKGLTFLGAKTTCKDRWRQVLNEADRIENKYLFTLQQGVSTNQLSEMKKEGLSLVVPSAYKNNFDSKYHNDILTLKEFISIVETKQNRF